jgi:hypothetical protein
VNIRDLRRLAMARTCEYNLVFSKKYLKILFGGTAEQPNDPKISVPMRANQTKATKSVLEYMAATSKSNDAGGWRPG